MTAPVTAIFGMYWSVPTRRALPCQMRLRLTSAQSHSIESNEMLKRVCIVLLGLGSLATVVAAVPDAPKAVAQARKPVKKPPVVKPAPPAPPTPAVLPDLSPAQLLVAEKIVIGTVPCELGAKVVVKQDTSPGRFLLELGRQTFRMEPALTSTGAIRLEDRVNGAVWLQLGNKSMLLNQRVGKRLADSCVNLHQAAIATAMEQSKTPGLLDDEAPPTAAPPPISLPSSPPQLTTSPSR